MFSLASSPYATDYTIERSPSDRAEKLKVPDTRINYPVMQTTKTMQD
ncbi:MAG: hypothetical protein MJ144_03620 [Clostridia bacterium]|nr:hypothetical protein [Clostridia bacterium]